MSTRVEGGVCCLEYKINDSSEPIVDDTKFHRLMDEYDLASRQRMKHPPDNGPHQIVKQTK